MNQMNSQESKYNFLIVDDQELVLYATIDPLRQHYPGTEIIQAKTAQEALKLVAQNNLDLVVVDLSMPENSGQSARIDAGIELLKKLMEQYPTINIVVQSAYPRSLIRLKPIINNHEGGFTVADKSLPMNEMLTKVDWALRGLNYTPKEMRSGLEMKPEWLEMLQLAFKEGFTDRAISEQMRIAERTVRHYWTKIQDALSVYPEVNKNLRIQTESRAREEGLID
ncbi:response regulator receiver protein [Scytonema hofmannii PCC 7110]|uniref:Response regulator receiver protein n=1 Tax=Scytonema hofmannii PCC 7110 TaxID=128403 RepID=A0A139WZ27_9CYAN|nr:response regulator transcription factor [Scytonema hofmannii]KYC37709.1 response regulator receiver protein [Scytonema hofmannii PCC 7110]